MSEKQIPRHENKSSHETEHSHEHHEKLDEHKTELAHQASIEKSQENLAKIQEMAREEAENSRQIILEDIPKTETDSLLGVQHNLKATAYARTLDRTRQKLSKPSRLLSRITHSPVVDKISSVGSQSIARPSGILSGSICAFLGTAIIFYYSKHYGYKYNYVVFLVLFVGGFVVGGLIEFLVWLTYTRKRRF